MTPERAKYLIDNTIYGDLRYSFPREHCYQGGTIHEDGITLEEDREIKAVWNTMSAYTCYMDALHRIAKGDTPK